jgi:hypothetical protein
MKLLIAKAGLAGGVLLSGLFQFPSTPPMKLGLWETTSTMSMQMPGMNAPPQPPRTVKARVCVTAETWARSFGNNDRVANCTRSNESYGAKHYSFDISCPATNSSGHFEMEFSSEDSGHGKLHIDMSPNGHHAILDNVMDSHFVSSDCGGLAPGKPQVVP